MGGRREPDAWRQQAHALPSANRQPMETSLCKTGPQSGLELPTYRGRRGSEVGGGRFKSHTYTVAQIHADVWQNANQYYKAITPQLKISKFLKTLTCSSLWGWGRR